MALEITVPSPGESISEVTISSWLKKEGDWVEMDDPIAEFESDKATFEVNATAAGLIEKLIGQPGDTIAVGSVVAVLNTEAKRPEGSAPAPAKEEAKAPETKAVAAKPAETAPAAPVASAVPSDVKISPVAAQLLEQYGLPVNLVKGSGGNGRITKLDVLEAIVQHGVLRGADAISGGRSERREKMTNLRKTISKRLVAAKNETAMLTTFNEVNMKPVMDLRNKYKKVFEEKHGIGLGFMSFFTRAVCIALKDWPAVNASIEGDEIVYHDFCDISIAVSAPKGLVVPVIRSAEQLSLADIEKEVKRLAGKARDNKLTIDEMSGGTFTITNGGVFGSMMSTPIINPPQSGILGMHNIVERPVVENGQVVIRPIMYVALSYDHRIIDGKESVGFLFLIKQLLEHPERLLFGGKDPAEVLLGV
jgi:2-oxoglutarate dehydrogenase E2 component (dihydrolipoamide succinyltransferase)